MARGQGLPALTVVNRPSGPFQAICPSIGHALGGNDQEESSCEIPGAYSC